MTLNDLVGSSADSGRVRKGSVWAVGPPGSRQRALFRQEEVDVAPGAAVGNVIGDRCRPGEQSAHVNHDVADLAFFDGRRADVHRAAGQ